MATESGTRNILSIHNCTGCGACVEVCPKACLSMGRSSIDDPMVMIDEQLCIGCEKCLKICPENRNDLTSKACNAFVGYTDSSLKPESRHASGGIAGLLYEQLIKSGFSAVGGALWDKDMVKIRCVEKLDFVNRFYNSKYTYSSTSEIFSDIKTVMNKRKKAIVIAAPCQIAAIKSFFEEDYKQGNIFLVDIVCHGMPNKEPFYQYLNTIADSSAIDEVFFRNHGRFLLEIVSDGRSVYKKEYKDDMYYMSYLDNIIFRECCYKCKYACLNRAGDITIGDYDGTRNYDSLNQEITHKSLLLVNTERGQKIINKLLQERKAHLAPGTMDDVTKNNLQLFSPSKPGLYRKTYLQKYMSSHNYYNSIIKWWRMNRVKKRIVTSRLYTSIYKLRKMGKHNNV